MAGKWTEKWGNKLPMLLVVFAAGIVLMALGSFGGQKQAVPNASNSTKQEGSSAVSSKLIGFEQAMEQRMEDVLSEIKGAGTVTVSLFLAAGPEYNYASNTDTSKRTIQEQDQGGGSRVTTEVDEQTQLVMTGASAAGGDNPVVVREVKPEVQGVLVVAEGAQDPYLREVLSRAVQTLMGVPAHKVTVLPRK